MGFGADSSASLVSVVVVVVVFFFSGCGPMRDRPGLAEASTPQYFTVWKRGGGTLIARRQSSESESIETAIVPSLYACLSVIRATYQDGCSESFDAWSDNSRPRPEPFADFVRRSIQRVVGKAK